MYYEESDFLETADGASMAQIAKARRLTREYYFADYEDAERREAILRELFGGMGENVVLDAPIHCDHGDKIFLGNDVIIGMNCTFVDCNKIEIGNNVLIASNVQIYTAAHPVELSKRLVENWKPESGMYFCQTYALPVKIGDGCWIGGGAIILPGVTIGSGTVIGAGSVVTKDVPDNCLAAGNPCRVMRSINEP